MKESLDGFQSCNESNLPKRVRLLPCVFTGMKRNKSKEKKSNIDLKQSLNFLTKLKVQKL